MHTGDGDGWVHCDRGHRHWGRHGAAGLLLSHHGDAGDLLLLAHRATWSHHGGTWGIPGGARDSGESAETAALREAGEEVGLDPRTVTVLGESTDDHGSWSYVTVRARTVGGRVGGEVGGVGGDPPELAPLDGEATELRWVPVAEVSQWPLHPGFADYWDRHGAR